MSGGGGSTSGAIDFPEHMKNTHKNWLGYDSGSALLVPISAGNSLNDLINNTLDNNPYATATLTDPEANITDVGNEIALLKTSISNIDSDVDWHNFLDKADDAILNTRILKKINVTDVLEKSRISSGLSAKEAVDAALAMSNSEVLEHAREAYEKRADKSRIRSLNRFAGGMLDINAVNGSAFILGVALIESEHMDSINEFDANLSTELYSQGIQAFIQMFTTELQTRIQTELETQRFSTTVMSDSVRLMTSIMLRKVEYEQAVLGSVFEKNKLDIIATQEFESSDIDLDAKYANWGFDNYIKASNVLASISGASAVLPEKPSRVGSVLGGALGGASAGASMGPYGAAGGALLGGLAGFLE